MKVRTRFAPSPTGTPESIHLGFVIRALWNYAYAKKNNGEFVLRIEDTDKKRSRKDTEEKIYTVLGQFGIRWDEGPDIGGPHSPYRQSERLDKYRKAAKILVDKGFAYYDFDAPKREKEEIKESYKSEEYRREIKSRPKARSMDTTLANKRVAAGESYVVRVKIPEDKIFEYEDWILKKKIRFEGKEVPDLILLKSDGFPTYHLAVVVDDIDMQISHVFRGQEWISTTPIHLYLYEGFGVQRPEIGHFTVILDPKTSKKFSKRDLTGIFGVDHWLKKGYLPEALLNYLMMLGWAPKDNRELFTLDEFVSSFDQAGLQKANPTFNEVKLNWFNQKYINSLDDATLAKRITNFTSRNEAEIAKVLPLIKDRLVTLVDFDELSNYFFEEPKLDIKDIQSIKTGNPHEILKYTISVLEENWDGKVLEEKAREYCSENNVKVGDYFMNLRLSLTGKSATPPLWDVMEVLGKDETLRRFKLFENWKL